MQLKTKLAIAFTAGAIVAVIHNAVDRKRELNTSNVIQSSADRIFKVYRDPIATEDDLNKAIDEYVQLKKLYQPVPTD